LYKLTRFILISVKGPQKKAETHVLNFPASSCHNCSDSVAITVVFAYAVATLFLASLWQL